MTNNGPVRQRFDRCRNPCPSRESITPDTPLRLSVAAALAYPDGSMTASGLRREANRGRLAIERTAGKDYTTLANIERMRQLCRVERRALDSGFADARRDKDGQLRRRATWIILDGGRHFPTGCACARKIEEAERKARRPTSRSSTSQPAKSATSS